MHGMLLILHTIAGTESNVQGTEGSSTSFLEVFRTSNLLRNAGYPNTGSAHRKKTKQNQNPNEILLSTFCATLHISEVLERCLKGRVWSALLECVHKRARLISSGTIKAYRN